jgi:hypothetical protein
VSAMIANGADMTEEEMRMGIDLKVKRTTEEADKLHFKSKEARAGGYNYLKSLLFS